MQHLFELSASSYTSLNYYLKHTFVLVDSKHKEIFLLVGNILNDGSTVYWLCPLTSLALSSPLLHGM